ncbi:MFS transporter [Sphingomonas ginkgonis]|uniref:MFS transporter n=1 Tax=Sphingomonas ginkgonis TaxID=2315330 RepID=A0A429VAA2_9SPHN|nr:NnrU family protein [Sphingomonas ginkgonis]RST30772.1 MFS transporter [Sphingomonas ginkgonis]
MSTHGLLVGAAALFLGTHFLLSHPWREPLVRRMGEGPFRGLYSLVALLTFGALLWIYRGIGRETPLWGAGDGLWAAATLVMWAASILFVGSFRGNPALAGAPSAKGRPAGVLAITRHPMMWSFALWAFVHSALIATPKAFVLDATILILALGGAAGQDAKKERLSGERWRSWEAQTSFLPFGRGLAFPGWFALVGGTLLLLVATWAHPVPAGLWRWFG